MTWLIDKDYCEQICDAERLGQFCDDAGTWTAGDDWSAAMTAILGWAIGRATGKFYEIIRPFYSTVLVLSSLADDVKANVQGYLGDLAFYFLKTRRAENLSENDTENFKTLCETIGTLAKRGDLGDVAGGITEQAKTTCEMTLYSSDRTPVFNCAKLDGNIDDDPLDL